MKLRPLKLSVFRSKVFIAFLFGGAIAMGLAYLGLAVVKETSTNEYCESCHVHPHSTSTWKEGNHFRNPSGVVVNCIDCHLPPEGIPFMVEKAKAGARDLYAYYLKDLTAIDWDAKSSLDLALHYTFEESCVRCHQELFPINLSNKGVDAHLHYRKNREELRCINCHLKTGHFHEEPDEQILVLDETVVEDVFTEPLLDELPPGEFASYAEVIPGTEVKFEMVAVPGGTFWMGAAESDPAGEANELPRRQIELSPFWIGKFEVTWREYDVYYSRTVTRGKNESGLKSDAVTGPTPPYGSPDQGWGKGLRPAITMSHYAAQRYCQWLSETTGRKYRLPTEAEWEYVARAGSDGPYFFQAEQDLSWFDSFMKRLFGGPAVDEEQLGEFAIFRGNSKYKTQPAGTKKPNPWGVYAMPGNVREFCSDWYAADVLAGYPEGQPVVDPSGPPDGKEHVLRGGSFKSDPSTLRASFRDQTQTAAWLKTDPQTPKSVWWYSDCNDVGFRIVREYQAGE